MLFRTFYNYYEEGAELDQSKIPVALFEFLFVTIGSILMGVATGLICSYLFRHTRIRDYPKYEISLLFLFAYGAYALAESIELSISVTTELFKRKVVSLTVTALISSEFVCVKYVPALLLTVTVTALPRIHGRNDTLAAPTGTAGATPIWHCRGFG